MLSFHAFSCLSPHQSILNGLVVCLLSGSMILDGYCPSCFYSLFCNRDEGMHDFCFYNFFSGQWAGSDILYHTGNVFGHWTLRDHWRLAYAPGVPFVRIQDLPTKKRTMYRKSTASQHCGNLCNLGACDMVLLQLVCKHPASIFFFLKNTAGYLL